jgi:hypothetical protein
MILLSIACINCGSSTDDEKTSNTDPVDEGANGDSNGGSTMPSTNGGGGIDATGGDDDDADAGPTAEAPLTGQEPECVAAFTRISECYLSQAKCTPTAKSSAGALGTALSEGNCDAIAMQVGGLSNLAAQWNAQTACDAQTITGIFPSLDMIEQIKDLCETATLTTAECTSSCTNVVPCAMASTDENIMQALGNQASCEANCNMQPTLASIFRCGIAAGNDCAAVDACFAP